MCRCFIVVKLMLVRLLLASISGLTPMTPAYEYGYHPSAEEFDGVLRDTYRTWTHDILNQQTERELYKKSPATSEIRSYVPKFHIETQKRHDMEESPSSIITSVSVNEPNLTSSLNFHFDSDDNDDNDENDENENFNNVYFLNNHKEPENQMISTTNPSPELNLKPLAKPDLEKYSLNNLYHNNSHAHFPIYFTNPATGIVYSITEMGKTSENLTRTNGSIPIFITKDQYERDIQLLKQEYENKCNLDNNKNVEILRPSSFSRRPITTTTTSTTVRPQIIRLNRPLSSAQSAIKHLTPLKKPGVGAVVRKEITVKDPKISTPRPLRKRKKTKNKNNKARRTNPPGHQQRVLATARPSGHTIESVWPGGPTIVRGSRTTTKRPYLNNFKLPTQLEKPNFESTIFSTEVLPPTASSEIWEHHRLNLNDRKKRSAQEIINSKSSEQIKQNSKSKMELFNEIKLNLYHQRQQSQHFEFNSKLSQRKLLKSTEDLKTNQNSNLFLKKTFQPIRAYKNYRISSDSEKNSKSLKQKRNKRSVDAKKSTNFIESYENSDKRYKLNKNLKSENFLENFEIENINFNKRNNSLNSEKQFENDLNNFLKPIHQRIKSKSKNKNNKFVHVGKQTKLPSDAVIEYHENIDKPYTDYHAYQSVLENENKIIDNSEEIQNELKTNNQNINLSKSHGSFENDNNNILITNKVSNVKTTNYAGKIKFKPESESQNSLNDLNKNFQYFTNFIKPKDNHDNSAIQSKKNEKEKKIIEKLDFTVKPKVIPFTKIDNIKVNSLNEINENKQSVLNQNISSIFKNLEKSEKLSIIAKHSNQKNVEESLNKSAHKGIENKVIDSELVFETVIDKRSPMENEENKLHTIKNYHLSENENIKNASEDIKNIDNTYSITMKNNNQNVWKDNKNSLVNLKANNNRKSKYLYNNNKDKSKNIDNKSFVEIQLLTKTSNIARDTVSKLILKNSYSKFSQHETSKSSESIGIPSKFFQNQLHHIEKRSTSNVRQNVLEPKFVKKANSSTQRNFPDLQISDNTYVDSTTIIPVSVIENNTVKSYQDLNIENITKSSNDPNTLTNENQDSTNDRFLLNSKNFKTTNSSSNTNVSGTKKRKRNRSHTKLKYSSYRKNSHKKRKRIQNQTSQVDSNRNDLNSTDSNSTESSTDRSIKEAVTKIFNRLIDGTEAKNDDDNEDEDEDEDDDDEDDDDDDDDDEEDENENGKDDNDYYDKDLKEKPIRDNTSSAEEGVDIGALEEEDTITPPPTTEHYNETETKSNNPNKNKNKNKNDNDNNKADNDIQLSIRQRRPTANKKADDDEDDDDDLDDDEESSLGSNLGGFFRMIFYPVQIIMSSVMETFLNGKEPEQHTVHTYPQYTSYHNTLKQHSNDDEYSYDDDNYNDEDYDNGDGSESSLGGWLSSWFGLSRRNKKISSTTMAPSPAQRRPTKESSNWFQSWFGIGGSDGVDKSDTEDYDDYDKWFASWFGNVKPKARKRKTTTTSTTTQLPQVPILTIVDPMRNPQNWIGILAHHIINQTTTTTQNPLRDMWTKITTPETTSTTTENPEIPRKLSYNKYQIWRLKPQDDYQVQALEDYKKGDDGIKLQWLKGPSLRGLTDVLVPPRMSVNFQASLTFESIDHEVLIFDVGKAIAYEKSKEDYFFATTTQRPKRKQPNRYANKPPPAMTWMRYYEFDDIVTFMESMRMRYPQLVELIHIGRSYEGRPLIVMKIESKEAAATNSPQHAMYEKAKLKHKKRIGLANAVFIEAGIHGMEWIAPATATWIINELLKAMKTNKTLSDEANLIRNTTWFIMPVLNPDGYVYSHEYDRFWKKSRSRHISRPSGLINSAMTWLQQKKTKDRVCFGVDLDRNWNYQWGKRGSSKATCNEFFAGPGPFSEPETKALSEFLMDYRTHIKLFISMQAYGQIISYPYKANTTYDAERLDDFLDVAMVGTDGLRKKGSKTRYKIDSTNDLVENRSGCSDAFVAYDVGIPFSYTLQLADNGVHGYLLPSSSIESTSRDAFEIIKAMLDYI